MKQHQLGSGARSTRKRVGRGISAGGGKTAGRGTKGQKARTGGSIKPGFEGGQNPLIRKIPKNRGFRAVSKQIDSVTIDQITALAKTVTVEVLIESGLVHASTGGVKLIAGKQKLEKAITVKLDKASEGAIKALEAAGGSFLATPTRVKKTASSEAKK